MRSKMVLCGRRWAVLLLLLSLASTHAHIPVTDDGERIEATPVVVMAGDSSTPRLLGFLRLPPEGSGGHLDGGPDGAWSRNTLWLEGSGAGRFKREYSLEDFLVWMPSGDGPTEEWQHRPRDTSWMKEGIITTTVFLTTTVYTTVLRPPLITPSTVTSIHSSTKSPVDLISSSNSPNTAPDKGGGKDLGEGSEAGPTTVSYNASCNNHTNTMEGSQSDYPHSGGSGNQLPETSKEKNKNTQHKGEKINYITVTRTIMTVPPNVDTTRPPSLTTTTTTLLKEPLYDETDLVRSSIEYPGPSATFTASSATPILPSTYPPCLTVTINPVTDTTAIYTQPSSSSDLYGTVAPTATFSEGTGEFSREGVQSTPELPELAVTTGIHSLLSSIQYSTPGTSMSPSVDGSGTEAEGSGAASVTVGATLVVTTEIETTENSAGVSKSNEGIETSTETKTEAGFAISVTEQGVENFGVPFGITETNHDASGNDTTTIEIDLNVPMTDSTNTETEAPSGVEETQGAPGEDHTRDPSKDVATTTPTTLLSSTYSHQLPANTFRPLFERNSTIFHEIELFDLTTPPSDRNDSNFWDLNTDGEGTVNSTSDMDYPGFVINESDIFVNVSDGIHGTKLPEQTASSNETVNGTFGWDSPEGVTEEVGTFSNVSNGRNITQLPGQDKDDDRGSITKVSSLEPTIPDHVFSASEGVTSTMGVLNLSITLGNDPKLLVTAGSDIEFSVTADGDPELSNTTESDSDVLSTTESDLNFVAIAGSVEVVDQSPQGPEDETIATTDSGENSTIWVDPLITTITDSPYVTTVWGEQTDNTATSANGLDKEIFTVPFEVDDPYVSATLTPPIAGKGVGVDGTAHDDSTLIILPEEGPQVNESESEGSGAEDSPGERPGSPTSGGKDSEDAAHFHPSSRPTSSSHDEESESTLPVSPSKTVTPFFQSGVETSTSERPLLVKPSQAVPPTSVVSSNVMPDMLGPSFSQPSDAPTTTSTVDDGPATLNPQLTLPSDSATDESMLGSDGVVISTFTGTTETALESASSPSQEGPTEDPETTATYMISLTDKTYGSHEPSSTLGERITSTWPSSSESEFPVLTHTGIHVASTTTMPVSITISTASQEIDITSTLSTTTLPVIHTTVESVSMSITTDKSPLTSPSGTMQGTPWATEPTLGPQPSAPSPSNNATVPLDQRYWVRTVLEGPFTEDTSHLYWISMENKLTDVYKIAYERDVARQLGAGEVSMVALASTEPPGTTTTDPFENYTTIIARVKREVASMNAEPTMPTIRFLAKQDRHNTHQDVHIASRKFKIASGLTGMRIFPHILTAMTRNEKVPIKENPNIFNTIRPSYNVLVNSRRKRELIREMKQDPVRQWRPPPSLYPSAKVRKRSATGGSVKVRLHNITYDNTTDLTELVYTVFDGEEPILAKDAVTNMSKVDDMEMAVILDQVVKIKAEEYLQSPPARQDGVLVYGIIGAVVGAMMLLVFLSWLTVFLYKRNHKRDGLQPDSEAASPRSQLSANAYSGHINMAFSTPREEKLEGEPLPSTSHGLGNGLGHASPTGSQDDLISRSKQGPSLGPSKARARRRLQYSQQEEGEGDDEAEEGGDSRRTFPKEDYDTTEEEEEEEEATTDGHRRRPKSSLPWRRPSRHVGHAITEEPVYSSPNPANIQYQPSHSTYSKYDTTHSELTSSDVHYDPTHQLMANTQHSASLFTHKDEGSVFLPPPLLPPPKGFGKAQDSLFIPGTSLPRFLPPPRLYKQAPNKLGQRPPSQIDAYDYDPEAPPIPPRNYSREEAGLPPQGQGGTSPPRPQMKDAQVEAHVESDALTQEERDRRPSASSSQLSESGGSESSTAPHIGRLRRRFHDLLDDAFSLLNGQRPGDRVTPLTTPSPSRKGRSRSAAMQYRGGEEGQQGTAARPWSATAVHASPPAWKDAQVVGVVPLHDDRSPKSAWGDGAGRASARPGSARPGSARPGSARPGSARPGSARPGSARPGSARPNSGRSARSITPVNHPPSPDGVACGAEEPLDPDTGLRSSDPAVPLIRAIKEELRRFKSSISTESSTA
ncbi:mucin-22 isoform X2 [Procambarus clarkii]|uniref:mucin-22 isoform X2 n=1 Tax=Procambarus clarkii TaxID=6728 RepID=UPI003744642F